MTKGKFDDWECRCSAFGKIVTPSGKLTEGVKTYLSEVFIGEIYGVRKEAYGRALEKGVACEEDGFKMLNDLLYPDKFISKIKEPSHNGYVKGTPDTIVDGIVYDIKNAYDRFTFGKATLTHDYLWQVKTYLFLYKKTQGALFYCLHNLPEYMIQDEERKLFYFQRKWATMEDPDYIKACEELREAHNYDAIPPEEKFKLFPVAYTPADENVIYASLDQARKYLNELWENHHERIEKNKILIAKKLVAK